jgi:hypothetical protein
MGTVRRYSNGWYRSVPCNDIPTLELVKVQVQYTPIAVSAAMDELFSWTKLC